MRRLLLALLVALSISASPLFAIAYTEFPSLTADPSCATGEYKVWTNTTDNLIKMCQNGSISAIGTSAYTGTDYGPSGAQYDPDRSPDSADEQTACSDEFDGSSTGTWTWRNQGTATLTTPTGADYAVLTSTNQSGMRARSCAISNAADWTMTIKFSWFASTTASTPNAGLFAVETGTCASPTNTWEVSVYRNSTGGGFFMGSTTSGYGSTPGGSVSDSSGSGFTHGTAYNELCLQMRYVSSSKVMSYRAARDCRNWGTWNASHTFSSAPACAGFYTATSNTTSTTQAYIQWIRTITSSPGTSGAYIVGHQ